MRIRLLLVVAILGITAIGSQAQQSVATGSSPTPSLAPQDAKAVAILNQAIAAGGGMAAITAVSDYTATGRVAGAQAGSITIQGLGAGEFRMDMNLPSGTLSIVADHGELVTRFPDGRLSQPRLSGTVVARYAIPADAPMFPGGYAFPLAFMAEALRDENYALTYVGTTSMDNRVAVDVRITEGPFRAAAPNANVFPIRGRSRDYYVDPSNFQIIAYREDSVRPEMGPQEVHYSEYAAVQGVLMPHTILETRDSKPVQTIQLDQISFNTGLQNSSFSLP